MDTQVKLSVSGAHKAVMRNQFAQELVRLGFIKRSTSEFSGLRDVTPEIVRKIIDFAYDLEARYAPSQVATLSILSELTIVSLRRHRNRAI